MINYFQHQGLKFKYGKILLPKWCKRIKIDIGLAFNAPQTQIWLENQSDLIVFGFEPVKENYAKIIKGQGKLPKIYSSYNFKNFKFHKLDPRLIGKRAFIFPYALGNVDRPLKKKIFITANDKGCSSFYKPKWPRTIKTQTTTVLSLDYFVDKLTLDNELGFIEHIKSDCQGSDFDILKKGEKTLKKTGVYTIECENDQYFKSSNSFEEISNFFNEKNFSRYNLFNKILNYPNLNNFEVGDPTFYNNRLVKYFKRNQVNIYQKG